MGGSAARDNKMYTFDAQYIKEMKRERRITKFGLSDYLPNSLRKQTMPFENSLDRT